LKKQHTKSKGAVPPHAAGYKFSEHFRIANFQSAGKGDIRSVN